MNLEKIRVMIPGFKMEDFHIFDTVKSLSFETEKDFLNGKEYKTVLLVLENNEYQVEFKCVHTNFLRFQDTQLLKHFYISPMDFQGYELGDRENEDFRLYCYDVEIQRCEKLK